MEEGRTLIKDLCPPPRREIKPLFNVERPLSLAKFRKPERLYQACTGLSTCTLWDNKHLADLNIAGVRDAVGGGERLQTDAEAHRDAV